MSGAAFFVETGRKCCNRNIRCWRFFMRKNYIDNIRNSALSPQKAETTQFPFIK